MINQEENHSTNNPKVSVIMNCLNCLKYLREAIDSVYAQTYKDWEIILWDNASTDNSAEIAKSYDERLRYFKSEETVPLGKARNWAIEKARGEYIAFLDCDDIWTPDKLEKQLSFFNDPNVGLVYSDAIYFNDRGYAKRQFGKHIPPEGMVFNNLLTSYNMTLSTAVIRAESLNGLDHWFDEKLKVIEEADLFIRIAKDWLVLYAPIIGTK